MYAPGDKLLFLPANRIVYVQEDMGEGTIWVRDTLESPVYYAKWDEVRKLTPLEEVL